MSRFGMKKMRRKISQGVRTACKFRYIVTYEYLEVKAHEEWKPTELSVLWFRGHRTKSSIKPSWNIQIPNHTNSTTMCTAKWQPPYSVELIVTLYKDITGTAFKKKDYMFVMEDICGPKRKKLAIFPCNLASYVSIDGDTNDLELEFKSLSKKIITAKCGLKIRCEFLKEGTSIDDDMQSNFSHMSEAEEFSRMSELAEVSDEDYDDDMNRHDDIPEVDELELNVDDPVAEYDLEELHNEMNQVAQNEDAMAKIKSKPWSKFVAEMNTFEWKQISMLRNPLSSNTKKKRIADQLREKQEAKLRDESLQEDFEDEEEDHAADKRLIKAKSFEVEPEESEYVVAYDDIQEEEEEEDGDFSGSMDSLNNGGGWGAKNSFKGSIKKTLKNVTTKTQKLRTLGPSMDEVKELEAKIQERDATIWNLEKESKELIIENNKFQDDVFDLQKQREELQGEISELQVLVEDLKMRLGQSEAEHKKIQEEEKELLARMNLCGWLCKRGIKGITGRNWRRRWFSTDKSGRLYYYKQNNNSTPQGFIDLDQIISVESQSDDKQDKNMASFNVTVQKRKYELMARDAEEKVKWINALDYLRHWRSHTAKFLKSGDGEDGVGVSEPEGGYDDTLNPFS